MAFGWPQGMQGGFGQQPWMASRAGQEGGAYGPAMGHPPMSVGTPPPMNPAMQPGMMQGPGNPAMQGGPPPMPPAPNPIQQTELPPPGAPPAPAPAPGSPGMDPRMLGVGLLGAGLMDRSRRNGHGGGLLDSMGGAQGLMQMASLMRPGAMPGQPAAPGMPMGRMGPGGLLGHA